MAMEHTKSHEHYDNNFGNCDSDADVKLEDFIVQTGDFLDSKAEISLISDNLQQSPVMENVKVENHDEELNEDVKLESHSVNTPYKCDICQKGFVAPYLLKIHKLSHIEIKQYQCEACGKCFLEKNHYTGHKAIYSDDRLHRPTAHNVSRNTNKFSCVKCRISFKSKIELNDHIRSKHLRGEVLACGRCGWKCKFNYDMIKHTGEKPLTCEVCTASFCGATGLRNHMSVHAGHCAYSCEMCPAKFNSQRSVTWHMKWHVTENV